MRFLTAGESHGPRLTAIMDGLPAGLPLGPEDINRELARRQEGYGSGGRMNIERDEVQITSGVAAGLTTGAPIAMTVENRDFKNWREKDIAPMTTPRPGHADLTGAVKYGYRDLRVSLERASARETTMRVAAGAIARKLLDAFGIVVGGYVTQIGSVIADIDPALSYPERFALAESNDVRTPSLASAERMHEEIRQAKIDKDTLGGIIEVVVLNAPVGLGTHVQHDRRLDARVVAALVSIHAMKGAEIGDGFLNAGRRGSEVHDEIGLAEGGVITRKSNRAGGFEGGITTGEPIIARVAMKPIATVMKSLGSVNLATGAEEKTVYERSDFCAVTRAVPICEAMVALVIADALVEKLGGDSIGEMKPRFDALRRARLEDLPMDNVEWRFGYPV
ncbi:MAG: chorismate synthase [Pleurocapsa minor GSE-CHR-MK-17-07R]|nr:chorismate synthase [Pleurocapsa minor GSE-CHR-MK 17-07R]